MDDIATPDLTPVSIWSEDILGLPGDEQIRAVSTKVLHDPGMDTMMLDVFAQHHRLLGKMLTDHSFSDRVQHEIARMIKSAAAKD